MAFGEPAYCREELVAEMGAAYVASPCGIEAPTLASAAAYLNGWLKFMRDDPRALVQAAAQAQRASDWMLGVQWASSLESTSPEVGDVGHSGREAIASVVSPRS